MQTAQSRILEQIERELNGAGFPVSTNKPLRAAS
jgi:hypothetical protein